jgi:hypothetical protein
MNGRDMEKSNSGHCTDMRTRSEGFKRRITTYDDLEDSFSISIIGEQKMPKFNTTSTKYKVTFQDLDIRGIPNT